MSNDYDAQVERLVLKHFKAEPFETPTDEHMAKCPSLHVSDYFTSGSQCDSGCESTNLEAELKCDHFTSEFAYGTWGDMASLIEELEEDL